MKRLLLLCSCLVIGAGCKSLKTIFQEREMLKLHVENAQRYYHAAKYDSAVQQANKALDIDADDPKARTILGYCYLQVARYTKERVTKLKYYEMTEEEFTRAIEEGSEREPAVFKAYFGLGLVYFMWSQEVDRMIEESRGKKIPRIVAGSGGESEKELWSE